MYVVEYIYKFRHRVKKGIRGGPFKDEFSDKERLQLLNMPLPPGSASSTITDLTVLTICLHFSRSLSL